MEFVAQIQKWYEKNARELPWRKTTNPYYIWISEIILQQTRVNQGLPYFERFVKRFPDVETLSRANEREVLKYWQGLGYYSRARNLHAAAKQVVNEFGGKFPNTYSDLLKLKGVGEYTAAAIASMAFSENKPVLDGNVFRLVARYFGIKEPIDKPQTKKIFYGLLNELIKNQSPALFNQAIMEFGALQCKPVNPNCDDCPLKISCYSFKNKTVNNLPFKVSKTTVREEFWYYLVVRNKDRLLFRHRHNKGIFKNLYDFLCIESKSELPPDGLLKEIRTQFPFLINLKFGKASIQKTHLLSHRRLNINFLELKFTSLKEIPEYCQFETVSSYKKLPLPRVIEEFLVKNYKW